MALDVAIWNCQLIVQATDENKTIASVISGKTSGRLSSTGTPDATESFDDTRQLSGGTDTIDLGSLPDSAVAVVKERFRGLKLRLIKVFAATANTADVTVKTGATSGHALFGTSGLLVIPPDGVGYLYAASGSAVIASGVANIDITSGDADAIYSIHLVAGTA